ncbi:MAG: hypothetical protein OWU33_15240 [Firmicutes bacterium]|jgi:hypothetical protein|nr:hypothetical protein [Bacillota bacterium]
MAAIELDTDFAHIDVQAKHTETREFLLEHALHMLMAEYRQEYGRDAAQAVLQSLLGYHGR